MGGRIAGESLPGQGSTFRVWLPMPVLPAPANEVSSTQLLPWRVLVAEDNLFDQKVIVKMLSKLGMTVTVAANGAEAVKARAAVRPDLICMDLQMPVMDGFEASRRIRDLEEATGQPPVPVLAISANSSPEDRAACKQVGMQGLLAKPISLNLLQAEIRRLQQVFASF